jgi:hypothetical protein
MRLHRKSLTPKESPPTGQALVRRIAHGAKIVGRDAVIAGLVATPIGTSIYGATTAYDAANAAEQLGSSVSTSSVSEAPATNIALQAKLNSYRQLVHQLRSETSKISEEHFGDSGPELRSSIEKLTIDLEAHLAEAQAGSQSSSYDARQDVVKLDQTVREFVDRYAGKTESAMGGAAMGAFMGTVMSALMGLGGLVIFDFP